MFLLFIFSLNVFVYLNEMYFEKCFSWFLSFKKFEINNEIKHILSHCKNMRHSINNCNFVFFKFYQQVFSFRQSLLWSVCKPIAKTVNYKFLIFSVDIFFIKSEFVFAELINNCNHFFMNNWFCNSVFFCWTRCFWFFFLIWFLYSNIYHNSI